MQAYIIIAILFIPISIIANASEPTLSESEGRTDRAAFESWYAGLSSIQRPGAEFWIGERSKPKPGSCFGVNQAAQPEFVAGCQEAQRQLALPDIRRKTEPSYRLGWNTLQVSVDKHQAEGSPHRLPQATTPSTVWYVMSARDHICFLISDAFNGAKTPENIITNFRLSGVSYIIHRNENGMVSLHNVRERDNVIMLFSDKDQCEFLAKLKYD